MKKTFTSFLFFCLLVMVQAQWSPTIYNGKETGDGSKTRSYYSLDLPMLRSQLSKAQETGKSAKPVVISLPTLKGKIEQFAVYSFPVVVKELADQYQLGSYVGVGIDDPTKYLRFSLAPNDFQSMIITSEGSEFIEPANAAKTIYSVHPKTQGGKNGFVCSTRERESDHQEIENLYHQGKSFTNQSTDFRRSSDRKYRTLRLAMSVTGEYTQFFGGTVAGALTAINATLTRVNGIFEKDFALHLNLQNYPNVIYTNPNSDPYSPANIGNSPPNYPWSTELQQTLASNVGHANYDIGHLFGASGGGGMAGCIGCVCLDPGNPNPATGNGKGSGYTSPSNNIPQGDTFDVDFVAHEMGHQLGGNHTFMYEYQTPNVQFEPGSGTTIMGYAGVANGNAGTAPSPGGTFDIQPNSDAYFLRNSINQVQTVLTTATCDIETPITNNPPVIAALPTYNIPKGTAFVLTASATDVENDPMTYTWEQADAMLNNTPPIDNINLGNTTSGASFRSVIPSTSPTRYFPKLSSVLAGVLHDTNGWEAVSTVARTTKFSITVRDNHPLANQQQTQSAVQTIIVGNNGPFKVNPTTVYNNGPTNVTWDVVNTNAAPYNAANVKIDFTTDNGITWNVVAASTPNDGTESLDFSPFPLIVGGTAKIRVSAINNVFYAVGNAPIETLPICSTTNPPGGVVVSAITQTSATITWNASFNATYVVRYRVVGVANWTTYTPTPITNTVSLTGLTAGTHYEVQIANICSGVTGPFSAVTVFMTPYCTATSSNTGNGYISNVTVSGTNAYTMSNDSGANNYTDYSTIATKLITLVRGTANNTVSVSKSWPAAMSNKAVSVWIDFDKNGTFDTAERILNNSNNQTTPVTAIFQVPATAYAGTLTTRMRVVLRDMNNPAACASFANGEVEDYAVKIIDIPACTSAAPSNIAITNFTPTSANISWMATTGATYILRYRKVGTVTWTTINPVPAPVNNYTIQGLTEQTQYEVQVATKCNGSQGNYSASQQFTTPAVSYCPMTGTGTNHHISNVTITSINPGLPVMSNNSVQTNYTSYTTPNTLITLEIGSTANKISVAKGWTGATGNAAVTAWIDFNRNGQFENTERILISSASTTTPISATFDVPSGAYSGPLTTTMRVVLGGTTPVMCQNAINGEVEDYAVQLKPCSTSTPTGLTFNTITHNSAIVNWTAATNNLTYLLQYRVQGTATWTDVYVTAIPHTLNNLVPSATYEVQVAANCGITNGTFTPIGTFSTRCDPTPPNITISNITASSALITWNPAVVGVSYMMRWRKVGTTGWPNPDVTLPAAPASTYTLGNLAPYTHYEVQIANRCAGETTWNPYSNPAIFTTERICELPPPGLTITQLFPTSAYIRWDAFPGATYVLRYRKVGIPSWSTIQVPTNTYTLTGLLEFTKYEMQVANVCNGTPAAFTPLYYFTTPTVVYCKMASGSSAGEHVAKVTVKPNGKPVMENASGASSYTDYSGVSSAFIELIQGSADNEISIEKAWTGQNYNEGIAVWIDFNRNGEFDINERVFSSPPNTTTPVSGRFSVPADAFVSMTDYKYVLMRVAMQRDGVPANCINFGNGEVEDYSVRISRKIISNPLNQTDILIYPNPVSSILYVKNISKRAKYKIYNAVGQVVAEGILLNNQMNVSKLIHGVYVIDIDNNGTTVQKKFIKE